jgi:predicted dehydrogenase
MQNCRGLSRRGFLAQSLGAMVAAGLPLWYAREILAFDEEQASKVRKVGPNDKIAFGLVGCGGMGRHDVGRFIGRQDCRLVALCDVDSQHLDEAANQFRDAAKKGGTDEIAKYKDFRDLVGRKDLDFVIVATPDHWHTLPAIAAMKSGKDVYCEKPLTLTVEEGKALAKVAKANSRILQVGSQQRSEGKQWHLACELIRNGRLGKLKQVETWIGANPQSPALPKAPVPATLDYDFWLGPTPKVEYLMLEQGKQKFSNCHYEFRWWYQWSGGKVTDWGAHHNDIAQWALGMDGSGPVAVQAEGTPPASEPNRYNCHPTFKITYTYADGTPVICQSKENGVRFEGERGWIFVNRSKIEASDGDGKTSKLLNEPLPSNKVALEISTSHGGNFIDCLKSRKPPITNVEVGYRSVSVCHIGNICLRLGGSKLQWNPAEEKFTGANAEEANKWLSRPYRAPWKLEA